MDRHVSAFSIGRFISFSFAVMLSIFVSLNSVNAKLMSEKETSDLLKQQPKIIFSQKKPYTNGHLVEYWVMDKNGITFLCRSWMDEEWVKVQARCFDGRSK